MGRSVIAMLSSSLQKLEKSRKSFSCYFADQADMFTVPPVFSLFFGWVYTLPSCYTLDQVYYAHIYVYLLDNKEICMLVAYSKF